MNLTKIVFPSEKKNDGIVDIYEAHFPRYFKSYNLGAIHGDHLLGQTGQVLEQRALIGAHVILLDYLGHFQKMETSADRP